MYKIYFIFLAIMLLPVLIFSADWYVDGTAPTQGNGSPQSPYQTIADAVTNLSNGDNVYVAATTYYETVNFGNKYFNLYSLDGAATTIINGSGTDEGIYFALVNPAVNNLSLIKGFTITNCQTNLVDDGGGISIINRNVTIMNCIIDDNESDGDGGGIAFKGNGGYTLTITSCTISNNHCDDYGGGIYYNSTGGDEMVINESEISENASDDDGGGIYGTGTGGNELTISDSEISENESDNDGGGLYFYSTGGDELTMDDSRITGNTCDYLGGGIFVSGISGDLISLSLENLEIDNNESTSNTGGSKGGGIYAEFIDDSSLTFQNLLIYENHSYDHGSGIFLKNSAGLTNPLTFNKLTVVDNVSDVDNPGIFYDSCTNTAVINSIVWNESGNVQVSDGSVTYCCIYNGTPTNHNINDDPEFVDASGDDYTLEYYSPCIDTGDDDSAYDDPDGSIADMGYKYHEQDIYTWSNGASAVKYIWKSYPKLPLDPDDFTTNEGDDICVDEAWEFWNPIPDGLYAWYLLEGTNNEFEIGEYDQGAWDWTYSRDINSTLGYKLEKDDTGSCLMFSRGLKCEDNIRLNTVVDEVWLGYFLEDSQLVLDAFPSAVINDAILIKTQDWGISRRDTDSPWSGTPASCYINYADCVVIETVDDDHEFPWETPSRGSEPYYRPRAEHFTFDDDIDYIPVYAAFDENDMPDEIAIYVDDVCRGAQVVEDTVCQICAYILEEELGEEIEFAFWYEGRNSVERMNSYLVYNQETDLYESRSLITGMPGIHYEVSFKDQTEDIVPVEYDLSCYPNPFNPELTISFSTTESTEYTEITIFNVKGQKVKTLVSELFRPDDYNIVWKGDDNAGNKVSSGVYYIRLQVGDDIVNRKVILMK